MSQLQNGSNLRLASSVFTVEDQSQVGEARRAALSFCEALGFDEVQQGRISIIVNELGTNLVKYASRGELVVRCSNALHTSGIEILAIDHGPGIANVSEALKDGFTTGSSPGTGLGSIQRQADDFDIFSKMNQGTVVYAIVYKKNIKEQLNFNIGAISVPIEGETVCGDAWCVHQEGDRFSVLVADGLGHGPLAHLASEASITVFAENDHIANQKTLTAIHKKLQGTRGAAVFVAEYLHGIIHYLGAGNIRALIQSFDGLKTLISQNGTAGLVLPNLKKFDQAWESKGFLILHSDGINNKWDLTKYPGLLTNHPAIIAGIIYRDFNRKTDDSTVVVIGRKK